MIRQVIRKGGLLGQSKHSLRNLMSSSTDKDSSKLSEPTKEPQPHWSMFEAGNETRSEYLTEKEMYTFREKHFLDKVRLHVFGGNGGVGVSAHLKDHRGLKSKASGGSGGHGGAVIIRADLIERDLSYIKSKHVRGNSGKNGMGDLKPGKNGKDLHYSVPIGSVIYELTPITDETGSMVKAKKGQSTLENYSQKFIADLCKEGDEVRIVRGGSGGIGNMHDSNVKGRNPGQPGEYKLVLVELKVIADIGFVGMPNAGKSTLLAALTRCKPKIAPYAFTTLSPNIGKLRFIDDKTVTLADIPGLIEGSSANKGLGFEFLKHVEKSKVLCYVIDMSNTHEYKPWNQFTILQRELSTYSSNLAEKEVIIVGNKCDLKGTFLNYEEFKRRTGLNPIMTSAKESQGLEDLVMAMRDKILGKTEEA